MQPYAADALKTASDAARTAQMAANGVGLAEGAKPPTAGLLHTLSPVDLYA